MTDEVYAILHPSESKKCERLSDYGYDDIVKEIAGEVEHTFADEEIYDKTDKYDVKVALAKALRTWAPDLLLNIAEDAMEKLGYFAKDYDAFMSVVNDAVGDALND
jgi:dsDNA-binding SOS-regulon protein